MRDKYTSIYFDSYYCYANLFTITLDYSSTVGEIEAANETFLDALEGYTRGCDNQPNKVFFQEITLGLFEFKDPGSFTYYYSNNKEVNDCVVKSNITLTSLAIISNGEENIFYTLSVQRQFTPSLESVMNEILKRVVTKKCKKYFSTYRRTKSPIFLYLCKKVLDSM